MVHRVHSPPPHCPSTPPHMYQYVSTSKELIRLSGFSVLLFIQQKMVTRGPLYRWTKKCSFLHYYWGIIALQCCISFCSTMKWITVTVKSLQSCPTLCDPTDGSPPGSPVPGILQARTLEWVAISLSNAWKWKVKVKLLSGVRLFVTPWTAAHQPPPSMGFSRPEYWSGVPLPSPMKWISYTYIYISSLLDLPSHCTHHRAQSWASCALSQVPTSYPFDTCTPVFTAALLILDRTWKQSKCPITGEQIKKKM